jgi:hypothetical protein
MNAAAVLRDLSRAEVVEEKRRVSGIWWEIVCAEAQRPSRGPTTNDPTQDDRIDATVDVALKLASNAGAILDRLAASHPTLAATLRDGNGDRPAWATADRLVRGYIRVSLTRANIDRWRHQRKHDADSLSPGDEDHPDAHMQAPDTASELHEATDAPDAGLHREAMERLFAMTVDAAMRHKSEHVGAASRARVADLVALARGDLDMGDLVLRDADPPPPPYGSAPWRSVRDTLLKSHSRVRKDLSDALQALEEEGTLQADEVAFVRRALLALRRKN